MLKTRPATVFFPFCFPFLHIVSYIPWRCCGSPKHPGTVDCTLASASRRKGARSTNEARHGDRSAPASRLERWRISYPCCSSWCGRYRWPLLRLPYACGFLQSSIGTLSPHQQTCTGGSVGSIYTLYDRQQHDTPYSVRPKPNQIDSWHFYISPTSTYLGLSMRHGLGAAPALIPRELCGGLVVSCHSVRQEESRTLWKFRDKVAD